LVENARDPWLQVQVVAAGLLGLFALLTVLSLRKPLPRAAPVAAEPETTVRDDTELVAAGAAAASTHLDEELDVAREQLKQAEEAYRYLETRLKKTQEELARTGAAPGPELEEQIASAQRDREMAEARAELAERRLAEMQQRMEHLGPDPSAPPAVVQEAAPVANGATRRRPDEPPPGEPSADASPPAHVDAPEEPAEAPVGAPAVDAEETPVSDPASELRARLARTAARKKLGPNVGD
jgi:hypothetical protein